ncbi:MAG: hypothetical protein JWQ09_220 [Segetibacter sp.]|nr:hypothetical protein [Segetibacter sp.]
MLVKRGEDWYAYEVKSTTKVKPEQLPDAAFQYYVITHAGLNLKDFSIVHLNNAYVRKGTLNINQLFAPESILASVIELQGDINTRATELKVLLQNKTDMPAIVVGNQCNKPYPCDFQGFCFEGIEEEEPDYGVPYINKDAISKFLDQLAYPLYHMDFESWMTAVPEYDGHWPYRQVCFQFSVHVQKSQAAEPEHHHYLADHTGSHTEEFLIKLIEVLGNEGTVLVYNKSFEASRLKELVREYPHHEERVGSILNRIVDLMAPFRKNYRLPEMEGSYSIKKVLPSLVPGLSYDGLMIENGGDASAAFFNLREETDAERRNATRNALLEYCGLDTLAMVKILEKLNQLV